jgi:hypothetical protein
MYNQRQDGQKSAEITDCFVQGTQAQVFGASLAGFLFGISAVIQAYAFISPPAAFENLRGLPLFQRAGAYITEYPFDFVIFFASVFSMLYFFKTAALNFDIGENVEQANLPGIIAPVKSESRYKFSSAHIILSFAPIIWAFLNAFKCFFDLSRSVNSPLRIYELVSFLAISMYFVAESRMLTERRETSRFFTFAYIAVILAAASSLPNLIWSSFWMLHTNNDQVIYGVELVLVVYILSRIYSQIRYGSFSYKKLSVYQAADGPAVLESGIKKVICPKCQNENTFEVSGSSKQFHRHEL